MSNRFSLRWLNVMSYFELLLIIWSKTLRYSSFLFLWLKGITYIYGMVRYFYKWVLAPVLFGGVLSWGRAGEKLIAVLARLNALIDFYDLRLNIVYTFFIFSLVIWVWLKLFRSVVSSILPHAIRVLKVFLSPYEKVILWNEVLLCAKIFWYFSNALSQWADSQIISTLVEN